MAAVLSTPHNVQTTLNYYAEIGDEAPYNYVYEPPAGVPRSNVGTDTKPVEVHDVRGQEDSVSLDKTGFQFVKHTSQEKDFLDEEKIKAEYYKEVEELLKRETGAKRVFIFDHTIRRNYAVDGDNTKPMAQFRGPVERVHIDQTYKASVNRVHHHLGAEAERLLKGRVRIINVWRPIGNPVEHKPLAVCDWRTLSPDDLVPTRHIYPDREGSTFAVRYNPQHRWHFLARQAPDEVTLIKCFDSDDAKARLTPHSAFLDTSSPKDAPLRQSIEVRALVFDEE